MTDYHPQTRKGPDNELWYVVATAHGEAQAAIYSGILQTEDIPVWVYWEPAGRALGLTVGPLGTTEILTPAAYYERALDLLMADEVDPLEWDSALDDGLTIDGAATDPDDADDLP